MARYLAAAVVLVAVVGAATSGCRADQSDPARTPYVQLNSGTYKGQAWRLLAWEQASTLCMELIPKGSDPDHPPTKEPWPAAGGGGCEFDTRDPSGGYYTGSTGPAGSMFSFGPLPTAATRIRVATHEILPTTPLPRGKGLPNGRYWLQLMPAGWPTKADGTSLDPPQPLNAGGESVPYQAF